MQISNLSFNYMPLNSFELYDKRVSFLKKNVEEQNQKKILTFHERFFKQFDNVSIVSMRLNSICCKTGQIVSVFLVANSMNFCFIFFSFFCEFFDAFIISSRLHTCRITLYVCETRHTKQTQTFAEQSIGFL